MFHRIIRKIVGTKNDRELRAVQPIVARINELEPRFVKLSDEALAAKMPRFRERLDKGEALDELLPEVFAVTREASRRVLKMRHFDVQLIGGIFLHRGYVTEMKTGEGKTLVATLPLVLNGLTGKGAHLVTVNDYLARRDSEWMGRLYRFLGLSVGTIVHDMEDPARQAAYRADITYGTNNEFGFDYLRDNMKFSLSRMVHRYLPKEERGPKGHEFHYAIVDEVDSILIDEARTPLIISGQAEDSSELYYRINEVIPLLKKDEDYTVDEKANSAILTEEGVENVERILRHRGLLTQGDLYHPNNIELLHHVNQALRAHTLYKRDVNYVVSDGKVVIVDEFTGRLMPGRRWSDGLHQAVEAKEGVRIESENQTLATISFQNYFRLYRKLAGMTGTADTEAVEFNKIYNLDVVVIPTNKPCIRQDFQDVVYKTEREKFEAVIDEIEDCYRRGQPVLVGTTSVEKSEVLSRMLRRRGIPHNVLNAKHHEREAEIVAQAGRHKAVTISTNMAGRGTDILLGGNPEWMARARAGTDDENSPAYQEALAFFRKVCEEERALVLRAGGLHILGTERHESRRIDNQLRGRAGRQGDPGTSRFYLSLEDDLMRIFGSERLAPFMERLGMQEGEPIEHRWVTRAIENAQKRVEGHNFDIRKHLLEYDDVMNLQRKTIYDLRRRILAGEMGEDELLDMFEDVIISLVASVCQGDPDGWNLESLKEAARDQFNVTMPDLTVDPRSPSPVEDVQEAVYGAVEAGYRARIAALQPIAEAMNERYGAEDPNYRPRTARDLFLSIARDFYLREIDAAWREHLQAMDHLREGIGLRGYAQKDPKKEYQKEGYTLFEQMIARIKANTTGLLFRVHINTEEEVKALRPAPRQPTRVTYGRGTLAGEAAQASGGGGGQRTVKRTQPKVGRNDLCPCGSGKKYKKCCLPKESGEVAAA